MHKRQIYAGALDFAPTRNVYVAHVQDRDYAYHYRGVRTCLGLGIDRSDLDVRSRYKLIPVSKCTMAIEA